MEWQQERTAYQLVDVDAYPLGVLSQFSFSKAGNTQFAGMNS